MNFSTDPNIIGNVGFTPNYSHATSSQKTNKKLFYKNNIHSHSIIGSDLEKQNLAIVEKKKEQVQE